MQTTEVTVEEFERFVQQTGYRTYAQRKKGLKVNIDGRRVHKEDAYWQNLYFERNCSGAL